MPILIDYETRGIRDLGTVGSIEYAEDPATEILGVGVWDIDTQSEPVYQHRLGTLDGALPTLISWGPFDRYIYEAKDGGKGVPIEWIDAQALALYCGLPRSLEGFCRSVGIEAKKDPRGTRLINLFSIPREDGTFREMEPDDRKAMAEYCLQDVRLLAKAWEVLEPIYRPWKEDQEANYWIVDRMNRNGVPIDGMAVCNALAFIRAQEVELSFEFKELTGLSPNQVAQIAALFGLPDVKKETLEQASFPDDPKLERARQIRLSLASAAIKKLVPMFEASELTGRVRGCFINNGAHTGRCTSTILQFQNMKSGKPDPHYFEQLHNNRDCSDAIKYAKENIRGFVKPSEGNKLVVADFSQIEARILAWQANDKNMIDTFMGGEDPYRTFAAEIFKVAPEDVTDFQRQLGKIDILGTGFGVSVPGLQRQAKKYGVDLSYKSGKFLIDSFNQRFPEVIKLRWTYEQGVKWLVGGKVESFEAGECKFSLSKSKKIMIVELPSGRRLRYMYPAINSQGAVEYTSRYGVGTVRKRLWGGHITENLCQALAADIKFAVMKKFPEFLIGECHDEIILEVPEEGAADTLARLLEEMNQSPEWMMPGLIKATGKIMERYGK